MLVTVVPSLPPPLQAMEDSKLNNSSLLGPGRPLIYLVTCALPQKRTGRKGAVSKVGACNQVTGGLQEKPPGWDGGKCWPSADTLATLRSWGWILSVHFFSK